MLFLATMIAVILALSNAAPPIDFQEADREFEAVANIPIPRYAKSAIRREEYSRLHPEDTSVVPPNQLQDSKEQLETMSNEPFSKTIPIYSSDGMSVQKPAENNDQTTMDETESEQSSIDAEMAKVIPQGVVSVIESIVGDALTQIINDANSIPASEKTSVESFKRHKNSTLNEIQRLLEMSGTGAHEQHIIMKVVQENNENSVFAKFLVRVLKNQVAIEIEKMENMMLEKIKQQMFYHFYMIQQTKRFMDTYVGNGENFSRDSEYFLKFPLGSFKIPNKPVYKPSSVFDPSKRVSVLSSIGRRLAELRNQQAELNV